MKRQLVLGGALLLALALVQCGDSSTGPGDDGELDLTGAWTATMKPLGVTGPCPAATTRTGTATISKSGGGLKMVLSGGFDCSPVAACSFTGTVNGKTYTFTNGGVADNEGGTYTTALSFEAKSSKSAAGSGTSLYAHPGGQCLWVFDFTLSR